MSSKETKRYIKVGAFFTAAAAMLAAAIFMIGKRQQLFQEHVLYRTSFNNVRWLQEGAPVNLDGVTVGFVRKIVLPTNPCDRRVTVEFTVLARFADRIRTDTRAYIKTIGLLGDKYLELTGGSPTRAKVEPGGYVRGVDPAELERFIAGGEDLMENLLAISASLRVILHRVEEGHGFLGELTTDATSGRRISESLLETLAAVKGTFQPIADGKGFLGRLVRDDASGRELFSQMVEAASELAGVAAALRADLERDDSVWGALTRDEEGRRMFVDTLSSLKAAAESMAAVAKALEEGDSAAGRLLSDTEYGQKLTDELAKLVEHLSCIAEKIDSGYGTVGGFVNDPQLYTDLANVVRGVRSSKILGWLIRNRRKKGEKLAAEQKGVEAPEVVPQPLCP